MVGAHDCVTMASSFVLLDTTVFTMDRLVLSVLTPRMFLAIVPEGQKQWSNYRSYISGAMECGEGGSRAPKAVGGCRNATPIYGSHTCTENGRDQSDRSTCKDLACAHVSRSPHD